ncbi:hypothetical protein ACR9PT_02860 [Piscirickettsia salmonis]
MLSCSSSFLIGAANPLVCDESMLYHIDRKRRYLGRYFAHPMMQNRRAKRDDYKP